MFNIGGGELLVILLIALIVLGPQRMPEAARTVGRVVGEIRRLSSGFQREIREAFDENDEPKPRRTESAPLASAVADLDAGDDELDAPEEADADRATDAEADVDADAPAALSSDDIRNGNGNGNGSGNGAAAGELAPEVSDALDQIVSPPPAEPEVGPEASAS
jgi:sec-independent protein translocase protein TatB